MLVIGRLLARAAAVLCGVGLVSLALAATALLDDRLTGHWLGAIELPGQKLEYDIDFAVDQGGDVTGDISIPVQGATDLPLVDIRVSGDSVQWVIKSVPGAPTFDGRLAADGQTIEGEFTQAGQTFPFKLTRGEKAAEAAKAATDAALEGFGEWVDKARQDWKVPGVAVAIIRGGVKGGEVVFAEGFGERDTEQHLPVTTRTLFAIGSATKAFTTFTIGTLVDEGKLDWDKPVTTWLPEFRVHDVVASERMTPRDLVTHRSGLPRHDLLWYNNMDLTREQLVHRLPFLEESKDFRTTFQYNNLMFITAGYLVERVTGGTWEDAVRKRIYEPLGMTYSVFSWADAQKNGDAALGYEERDDQLRRMDYREIPAAGPAGSINSCLEDLTPWVTMQLDAGKWHGKELIKAGTLADMHAPHMSLGVGPAPDSPEVVPGGYGLGWFNDTYRGHRRVHHGGNIDGFSALINLVPQEHVGVIVLANMNGTPLPGLVNRHAIDRLLGLERVDWNAKALAKREIVKKVEKEAESKKDTVRRQGTTPTHDLGEYAGEYEHPGYGIVRIELKDERLSATYNEITNTLDHWHFEVFTRVKADKDHTLDDQKIMFLTGMDGEVDGLRASMEPSVEDAVFKKKADAHLSDPAFLATLVGEYDLPPQTIRMELKGTTLTATIAGQPTYELLPHRGTTFNLKGLSGFSVRFVLDGAGRVTEVLFIQPNGVFSAKSK